MSSLDHITALSQEASLEAAQKLQTIALSAPNKEEKKAARRALHLLNRQGVAIATENSLPTKATPIRETISDAYASGFDGAGNRLFWIVSPDPDGGRPVLLFLQTNDETGIEHYIAERRRKSEIEEDLQKLFVQLASGVVISKISPAQVRALVWRYVVLQQKAMRPLPKGIHSYLARIQVGDTEAVAPPELAEIASCEQEFSEDPEALFQTPWFSPWFFEVQAVRQWLKLWLPGNNAAQTEIDQKAAVNAAAAALFSPECRQTYATRLKETAAALWQRGERGVAQQALFHAEQILTDTPIQEIAFAVAMTRRTFQAAEQMMEERMSLLSEELLRIQEE